MIGGFRYSIVDMTLDGGLGDITLKGIQICDSVAESICGIKHINGNDYWVIVHKLNNNSFYVYQITNSGILPPVITNIGLAAYSNAGQMTTSVDGSKIGYSAIGKTMLFDFDNSTGMLSNYINLNKYTFGCSFSANCRFFYACYNAAPYDKIYQFDLYASNIPASVFEIANSTGTNGLCNMQLAPNGKIYIARMNSNYLDVINNPDFSDTLSNYIANDFYLGGQLSKGGLPNFINGLFGQCSFNIGIEANYDSNSKSFNVYPNPFHSSTTLEFKNLKNEKHNLTVYNTCGHILLLINNITTDKIKIERTNLTDGLYFFHLRTERQIIATGKFIIE
ncbi:MAG: hypothetical protein A2309_07735 [Bacteroidetes bacterium RIFOXYB2_FULL_35_7]|nr:MAG: hypothetical protein A2309_07735 [Bacteroidetes bacterium RIFOXYB2_FULL_35_7]